MHMVPKVHYAAHLCHQLGFFGMTSATATWRDETMNGLLRPVAQGAHRTVWHSRILSESKVAFRSAASASTRPFRS